MEFFPLHQIECSLINSALSPHLLESILVLCSATTSRSKQSSTTPSTNCRTSCVFLITSRRVYMLALQSLPQNEPSRRLIITFSLGVFHHDG